MVRAELGDFCLHPLAALAALSAPCLQAHASRFQFARRSSLGSCPGRSRTPPSLTYHRAALREKSTRPLQNARHFNGLTAGHRACSCTCMDFTMDPTRTSREEGGNRVSDPSLAAALIGKAADIKDRLEEPQAPVTDKSPKPPDVQVEVGRVDAGDTDVVVDRRRG
jgi:hypothetical protein